MQIVGASLEGIEIDEVGDRGMLELANTVIQCQDPETGAVVIPDG
jgi:hypothetical protein